MFRLLLVVFATLAIVACEKDAMSAEMQLLNHYLLSDHFDSYEVIDFIPDEPDELHLKAEVSGVAILRFGVPSADGYSRERDFTFSSMSSSDQKRYIKMITPGNLSEVSDQVPKDLFKIAKFGAENIHTSGQEARFSVAFTRTPMKGKWLINSVALTSELSFK